jgi:hypothetical protein
MAFTSPFDVAVRLGRDLTDAEKLQAQSWLTDVETLIRSRVSDYATRVGDPDFVALVRLVEVKAVRRVFLNLKGARQHSETIDDFTQSDTFDVTIAGSDLFVTDEEWQLLGAGSARAGSFSMATGFVGVTPWT